MNSSNGTEEFKASLRRELKEIHRRLNLIDAHIIDLVKQVAKLVVKCGIWGVLGGLISGVVALGMVYLKMIAP